MSTGSSASELLELGNVVVLDRDSAFAKNLYGSNERTIGTFASGQ